MSQIFTLSLAGAGHNSTIIEVECAMTRGLPALILVGLANRAVNEARERLRSAFSSSRFPLPPKRITINLAPADLPKDSPAYDLALAVALMEKMNLLQPLPRQTVFFGELGLGGDLKGVRGLIGLLIAARTQGLNTCYVPTANLRQALLVPDITVIGVSNLRELYLDLAGINPLIHQFTGKGLRPQSDQSPLNLEDRFEFISGQTRPKRALEIAAAGHHHILLQGGPGIGKTMLAKAMPSILPPLDDAEMLEVSHLHSLASQHIDRLIDVRPFRSPHHRVSVGTLIGGGNNSRPGEISLAHRGILFLDELPEFRHEALEALRQPLENQSISINRQGMNIDWPADFILVATGNPCPCGNHGTTKACVCRPYDALRYQHRLSGPLMDRIDLSVQVEDIAHDRLLNPVPQGPTSQELAAKVAKARQFRARRDQSLPNGRLGNQALKRHAHPTPGAINLLNEAAETLRLSARAYMRVMKVARTVADLEQSVSTTDEHIREALQFRRREAA